MQRSKATVDERCMGSPQQLDLSLWLGQSLRDDVREGHPAVAVCHGELTFACDACGTEREIPFACSRPCRACPWTRGRVSPIVGLIPRVPVRHWVVTLPEPWRTGLVRDAAARGRLRTKAMRELLDAIEAEARRELGPTADVHGGGVCAVHRCGTALEPNVHLHALVLDGVFLADRGQASFVPAQEDPRSGVLGRLARRLRRCLDQVLPDPAPLRAGLPARRIAVRQRVASGPVVRTNTAPAGGSARAGSGAQHDGLRIQAGRAVQADDRVALTRIAGYLARSELDRNAVSRPDARTIRYRLHRPFSDGTTHVEFSTDAFAARLRALGFHIGTAPITYHGVLAPRAALRPLVTPTQLSLISESTESRSRPAARRATDAPRCTACDRPMRLVAVRRGAQVKRTA